MKELILGTAGHIDHGKTSLVKALTGVNTDRLKEEQKRGITIELGFAALNLQNGNHLGIVDVPGHEKFIKNMVAGASGIDIVAMIIAADEGVMPQTREHMDICNLLGIKHGLVVITKSDMVDDDLMELALEDISDFVEGTFLENAPVVPVSSHTGDGIEKLKKVLDDLSSKIPPKEKSWFYRLPIDRVFTMKGFGTVVTGTSLSGSLSIGETITIYPKNIEAKIRGLQTHNKSVEKAGAGMRTAVNIQSLSKDMIGKGDVLASKNSLKPSYMIDAYFSYLKTNKKNLKNRIRIRFHSGTSETIGYLILLDRDEATPGDEIPVQIRLESPVCCVKDDGFVIRNYSPVDTIGGGFILNPIASKLKRFNKKALSIFDRLKNGSLSEKIEAIIQNSSFEGISESEIAICTNIHGKKLNHELNMLLSKNRIIKTDKEKSIFYHEIVFQQICDSILKTIDDYHEKNPMKEGFLKDEIIHVVKFRTTEKLLSKAIDYLCRQGKTVLEKNILRLKSHKVKLQIDMIKITDQIIREYEKSKLMPPYFKDIEKKFNLNPDTATDVLNLLLKDKKLIKVKNDLFFHTESIENLKKNVIKYFESNQEMTTADFKNITEGVSRKYLIPLLEFIDQKKITIRIGDIRKFRG